jgi:hypothetical protein
MALRRSGVRIPLGPQKPLFGSRESLFISMPIPEYRVTNIESHDRSSRSSRQREGKARWKPFNGTERECHLQDRTRLLP